MSHRLATLSGWIGRVAQRSAGPIDETVWVRWRGRVAAAALLLALLLSVQTALVHSPGYVIGALYHERRVLAMEMRALAPAERAKLLERLCLATRLIEAGGTDPYQIPGGESCRAPTGAEPVR